MDERSERIEKRFEVPMLVASALVIPALIIDEAEVGQPWETVALVMNYLIWTAFVVEMVVMLAVVPDRKHWLKHHPLEVIVVVLTPPFFIESFQSLRAVRLLRLLRLLRLAPLARRLFSVRGMRYVALTALLVALAGAEAFHEIEKGESFWDGLYWSISTMTTVGYGDLHPTTASGKVVAVIVMLVGIGFVALLTGAIAQRFLRPEIEELAQTEAVEEATEDDLMREVRELAGRMAQLERKLERRLGSSA